MPKKSSLIHHPACRRACIAILSLQLASSCLAAAIRNNAQNEVYQYFVSGTDERKNLGAYLWVPPDASVIRAVMVGVHNGLPITILQNESVRKVCNEYGIAQILLTPWSPDIGKVMLKDLRYDITDANRTDIYDHYIRALADVSWHPELVRAPVIPLAHSAFASFPCEVAVRDPGQCLMAMPIKAGLPNVYDAYRNNSKAKADLNMAGVPILFVNSHNQSTVPSRWKNESVPYGPITPMTYRQGDTGKTSGEVYERGNELFGECWEMMSCHFDMMPRDYEFVAKYVATVARLRLPASPPPGTKVVLKPLTLSSGWLVDINYQNCGKPGKPYFEPAPYGSYKGPKNKALWYPSEELARLTQKTMVGEYNKKFEMFTLLDRSGQPLSLTESPQISIRDALDYLEKDGRFTFKTYELKEPPLVCTNTARNHEKDPNAPHPLANVLFPVITKMPVSNLPVHADINGTPLELLADGPEFTFKLRPHRLAPEPGAFSMFFLHFYKEGNDEFAVAGRNVQVSWWPNGKKVPGIKKQTITFPNMPDIPRSTKRLKPGATSSSGLPVGYFVQQGPAVVEGDELVITQVPVKDTKPIRITVGAYQVGLWQNDGYTAAPTVYRSFSLLPPTGPIRDSQD